MICQHCQKEVPVGHGHVGRLHFGCFNQLITVFNWNPVGCNPCTIHENDLGELMGELRCEGVEFGETIEVTKKQMKAGEFFNLPKFQGF